MGFTLPVEGSKTLETGEQDGGLDFDWGPLSMLDRLHDTEVRRIRRGTPKLFRLRFGIQASMAAVRVGSSGLVWLFSPHNR
jgi:hypothetical protein